MVLHSKTWPITNRPNFDHAKTEHVQFLDPHCSINMDFFPAETQTKYYHIYSGWSYNNIRMLDWIITSYELTTIVVQKLLTRIQTIPCRIYVTDVTDRACACLKSVLRLDVDKDHRTLNWVLILHQTCTTTEYNCRQELKIVHWDH